MQRPYNLGDRRGFFTRTGRNTGIPLAIILATLGLWGCGKRSGEGAPEPASASAADLVAQADQAYSQRSDLMKVREGLVALRQAKTANPTDYEIVWRLAKFNYYLGTHTTDDTEKENAFHDGIEAGKLAVQLNNDRAEGHFWLGANYGGNAEISTLAGLSDIEDIKREMDAVLKIDERYEGGSAYMALGQVYLKAPRIFGGDVQKAIDYFEKGMKVGPNNGLMHLRLAQAYAGANRDKDAREQLKLLFEMKPTPGYEPEYNDAVKEGKDLEAKLK